MTVGREVRMIDRVNRVVGLYDLYGVLLTERQRELFEMYYFDDWSLAEIAENLRISRQAVHDNLKRAEDQLEAYERGLRLFDSNAFQDKIVQEMLEVWCQVKMLVPDAQRIRLDELLTALQQGGRPTERGDERA